MNRAASAIRERLSDGADILIDFATLGEYGYEAVEPECRRELCDAGRSHEAPVRLERFPARDRIAT